MHIVDAIKALKGEFERERDAHVITMTERDSAREALDGAVGAARNRAEKAEAELAACRQGAWG